MDDFGQCSNGIAEGQGTMEHQIIPYHPSFIENDEHGCWLLLMWKIQETHRLWPNPTCNHMPTQNPRRSNPHKSGSPHAAADASRMPHRCNLDKSGRKRHALKSMWYHARHHQPELSKTLWPYGHNDFGDATLGTSQTPCPMDPY